jgi:hypothetical protein
MHRTATRSQQIPGKLRSSVAGSVALDKSDGFLEATGRLGDREGSAVGDFILSLRPASTPSCGNGEASRLD